MQNKNNKKQLQKQLRRAHERLAAGVIALGMVTGTVAVSEQVRRTVSHFAVHPALAVIEHSNKESEVGHRAMRLESVSPADLIGGE
jgi:hypothetical protein